MSNSYTFTQSAPAVVWNIAHNLNAYPTTDVVIDNAGSQKKVLPVSVVYVDANNITINFNDSHTGSVRLIGSWKFVLNT